MGVDVRVSTRIQEPVTTTTPSIPDVHRELQRLVEGVPRERDSAHRQFIALQTLVANFGPDVLPNSWIQTGLVNNQLISDFLKGADTLRQVIDQLDPSETCLLAQAAMNESSFFRYPKFFARLRNEVDKWVEALEGSTQPEIRVAVCGAGLLQEPLSVLLTIKEQLEQYEGRLSVIPEVRIVVVSKSDLIFDRIASEANQGKWAIEYPLEAVQSIPPRLRERYFDEGQVGWAPKRELVKSFEFSPFDFAAIHSHSAPPSEQMGRCQLVTFHNVGQYINAGGSTRPAVWTTRFLSKLLCEGGAISNITNSFHWASGLNVPAAEPHRAWQLIEHLDVSARN